MMSLRLLGSFVAGIAVGVALVVLSFHVFMDPGPDNGVMLFVYSIAAAMLVGLVIGVVARLPGVVRAAGLGVVTANAVAIIAGLWIIAHSNFAWH